MSEPMSDDELIKMFEKDCRVRELVYNTRRRYMANIELYREFLDSNGGEGLLNPNKTILKSFVLYLRETRNHKKKTIDNMFSALNSFYDLLLFEELVSTNIILACRKRFLRTYKAEEVVRKIPDIDVMSRFVNSISKPRDRAIVLLFCKTGIRRNELVTLDADDINWAKQSLVLKPTAKRSNRLIYFDDEMANLLKKWMHIRESFHPQTQALFIGVGGERLKRQGVYHAVTKWAERYGLHNPNGKAVEDSFSPHAIRHWWTTMMRRGGMPRELIKTLRGDVRKEAIDIYDHPDPEELRISYLKAVPQLGVL